MYIDAQGHWWSAPAISLYVRIIAHMGCECVVLWETEEDFEKALVEEGRKVVRGLAVEYHIRDVAGLNMLAEWGSQADRPAALVSGGWRVVWEFLHFQLPGRDADSLD